MVLGPITDQYHQKMACMHEKALTYTQKKILVWVQGIAHEMPVEITPDLPSLMVLRRDHLYDTLDSMWAQLREHVRLLRETKEEMEGLLDKEGLANSAQF